jgi:radical SAM protein with 4Fe4S-binding SPASM domain
MRRNTILGLPLFLQVEPTNRCNLNCRLCLTGYQKLNRPKRDLSFDEFKKIIDQLEDGVFYLVLYNLGEPLLNSQLYQMVRYAKEKEIFVRLHTNGDFQDKRHIKEIISCGLDELTVSLDCATPEAYLNHKKSNTFENVIANIRSIVKERGKRCRPFINIQLLLTRENEKDIDSFKTLVRLLKIDKGLIKKARVNFPGIQPDASFLPLDTRYVRKIYKDGYRKMKCLRPWLSTVVLCDNSITPCCFDMQAEHKFGNMVDFNFREVWNNKKYVWFRKQTLTDINKISLCNQCSAINFFDNFL